MKCFRCLKRIEKKEDYYAIIRNSKGIKVSADYVHKTCWDKFITRLDSADQSLKQSNKLLGGMGNYMRKIGIIPDEEVIIA